MLLQVAANQQLYDTLATVSGQQLIYTLRAPQVGALPVLELSGPVAFMLPEYVLELKSGCSPLGGIFTLDDIILDITIAIGDRDGLLFICDQPPALCSPATCP